MLHSKRLCLLGYHSHNLYNQLRNEQSGILIFDNDSTTQIATASIHTTQSNYYTDSKLLQELKNGVRPKSCMHTAKICYDDIRNRRCVEIESM